MELAFGIRYYITSLKWKQGFTFALSLKTVAHFCGQQKADEELDESSEGEPNSMVANCKTITMS